MDLMAKATMRRLRIALLAFAVLIVLGTAGSWAAIQYLDDGALQSAFGGWDYPQQGSCPADTNQKTRPDCLALRFPAYTTSADCTNAATGGANRSWSTGVCNDLINSASQAACEAVEDRKWSNGICSIVLLGDDRNNVVCALHTGTWVTAGMCVGNWIMPARTAYTPPLLSANGPGDQCLRCHNAGTQYNGPRVRDTENFLYSGHNNMSRKVTINKPWGGPPFNCTSALYNDEQTCEANGFEWHPTIYPSDDTGNPIDWINGTITVGGMARDMTWIYGDWLAPLPRAIYKAPASASRTCSIPLSGACSNPAYVTQGDCQANGGTWTSNSTQAGCEANGGAWLLNAGASYSCARCHTTGWTSDATVNLVKEPEKSFPGITWDRLSDAGFGVVNTAGAVTGDPNKSSSWDTWGIACSRCHSSAIDTSNVVAGSNPPEYNAPAGMSRHHSNLTTFDIASAAGVCTDSRFTAQAQCDAVGAAWLTACSVAGLCSNPAYTTSGTCALNGGTWTKYDTQALCTGAGGTWSTSSCNVAGVCNTLNPAHSTQALCEGAGGQWASASDVVRCIDIHEYGKEHGIPSWEAARWTGSKPNRGQIIMRLCMDCHRQETGGMPYANTSATAGTLDTVNPGQYLKVGPAHGTVSFVSHPHGNMFLNSPHGQFTGTFSQIATGKFNFAGTGLYKSFFQMEGEAANTGNGCTGCHDVHESVVPDTSPFPAIREECTECHAKSLSLVQHPSGAGTPLENMATNPVEACETCHMPEGQHLWRVKADAAYTTLPNAAMTATVNANTSPDAGFNEAVWVDMDHACGQCHGGGTAHAETTGSIAAGSKVLTVASTTGFAANQRVSVADAGSLTYDDEGAVINGDFETYIVSVGSGVLNLAGSATIAVGGKAVVQNPTKNGAGYMTRTQLAAVAQGMHNDKPIVAFGYTIGSPNTLMVNVDASGARCSGSSANCDAYEWNWGDGTPPGSGMITSHTYATPGGKSITLTVEEFGVAGASATRTVNVATPDLPPTAAGTCSFDADTWTETVGDASLDDNGIKQITVTWGDGSVIFSDTTPPFGPATHTYLNVGTYTITHKAIDTIGQQNTRTCMATPTYFTISGTVFRTGGTQPLPSAIVTAKKGTLVAGTAYSAADGSFTIGNLKPGAYTLMVTRSGYTFSVPAASVSVGPSSAGNDITALTGLLVAPKQLTKDRGKQHHGRGTTTSDPAVGPAP
jgi:5-methylcytosine-specific restriction endonuclease McrA